MKEAKEETKELLWNLIMAVGTFAIVFGLALIVIEFYGAVSFCHSQSGVYSFKLIPPTHICNGTQIEHIAYKNTQIWGFKPITANFSNIFTYSP